MVMAGHSRDDMPPAGTEADLAAHANEPLLKEDADVFVAIPDLPTEFPDTSNKAKKGVGSDAAARTWAALVAKGERYGGAYVVLLLGKLIRTGKARNFVRRVLQHWKMARERVGDHHTNFYLRCPSKALDPDFLVKTGFVSYFEDLQFKAAFLYDKQCGPGVAAICEPGDDGLFDWNSPFGRRRVRVEDANIRVRDQCVSIEYLFEEVYQLAGRRKDNVSESAGWESFTKFAGGATARALPIQHTEGGDDDNQ